MVRSIVLTVYFATSSGEAEGASRPEGRQSSLISEGLTLVADFQAGKNTATHDGHASLRRQKGAPALQAVTLEACCQAGKKIATHDGNASARRQPCRQSRGRCLSCPALLHFSKQVSASEMQAPWTSCLQVIYWAHVVEVLLSGVPAIFWQTRAGTFSCLQQQIA